MINQIRKFTELEAGILNFKAKTTSIQMKKPVFCSGEKVFINLPPESWSNHHQSELIKSTDAI